MQQRLAPRFTRRMWPHVYVGRRNGLSFYISLITARAQAPADSMGVTAVALGTVGYLFCCTAW